MTAEIISEITTIAEDVTGLPTEELTTMAEEAVTNLWQKISGGATMGFSNALLVSVVEKFKNQKGSWASSSSSIAKSDAGAAAGAE